ncbi:NAD(P)-dependent oxidoreductase [Actinopolymorpha alba]|uniref:NAD(P)-dependent oxidoreductase n=1 Tax=Actinopolymorpha alba TaxID=533267 RepID=UPI000365C2B9|nr:SDR family oxidoreductase [Actinopolymorpha alba]
MRLTIFGATGGTGRQLVERALADGHEVTAVARKPENFPLVNEHLRVVRGDVLDSASVEAAVKGADAVLSALGPRSRKDPPVCGPGVANILAAMTSAGIRRFVGISAAPVPVHDPGDRLLYRLTAKKILRALLKDAYADMARMEDEARRSGLDWTIVRPPALNDKPASGRYRTALGRNLPGGYFISRADLAAEMLRSLKDPQTIGTTVGIAY